MKKLFISLLIIISISQATEYRVTNLKNGAMLNVRDLPLLNSRTIVGKIPHDAMGVEIRECRYDNDGREWCYISHLVGGEYLEGWVSRKFLAPMSSEEASAANLAYIKNFLKNYYMGEEKNYLDKLKIFHYFPMQQYMSKKNISHQALRTEKVRLYKRWPKRSYNLKSIRVLKRESNYLDVKASVYWRHARDSEDYESGKDLHKIRLVRHKNRLKIFAIKQLSHIVYPKPIKVEENNLTAENNVTIEENGVEKFYVKAGSFLEVPSSTYLQKITNLGYSYSIESIQQGEKLYRRVYIGPFKTTLDAANALDAIRQNLNDKAYIERRK